MAIIDTLKLARALTYKGGFSVHAAEGTADAINSALSSGVAEKTDIYRMDSKFDAKFDRLDSKLTMLMWAIGINVAATITMLVKHW